MDLNGSWIPYNKYANRNLTLTIKDNAITYQGRFEHSDTRLTSQYHLEPELNLIKDLECYQIRLEDDENNRYDYLVHEEMVEDTPVIFISEMVFEYDGRGRIVGSSYVRDKDLHLVSETFEHKLVKVCNYRPTTPMMQVPLMGSQDTVAEGHPNMGRMEAGRMNMGRMGVGTMNGPMPSKASATSTSLETPWNCSCGNKQITARFCTECGMPRPL